MHRIHEYPLRAICVRACVSEKRGAIECVSIEGGDEKVSATRRGGAENHNVGVKVKWQRWWVGKKSGLSAGEDEGGRRGGWG